MAKQVQLEVKIKGSDSVGQAAEKTKSLRSELKALQTDLQSGKLTGKAFDEGIKKAAQMKDQINDVNNRVKALATDGADVALKGFGDLTNGIVGGFAAAQGAMALFGSENEEVQKSLMKVQGAVALLNGVQAINNALQSDSAAMVALNTIKTNLLTFAQTRYTAAVGSSTGALKAFRLVGVTLGIGIVVAAITGLIYVFSQLESILPKVDLEQKALNDTMSDYAKGSSDANIEVHKMTKNFDLAKKGVISKEKALNTYNDKFGKTLGFAKDLNEAESIFIKKSESYIRLMGARAQANSLYAKAAELSVKEIQEQTADNISSAETYWEIFKGNFKTSEGQVESAIGLANKNEKLKKENIKLIKEEQKAILSAADSLVKKSLEEEKRLGISTDGGFESPKTDKATNKEVESEEDKQKRLFLAKQKADINLKNLQEQQLEDLANFEQQKNDIINQKAIEQSEIEDQRLLEQAKKDQEYRDILIQQETEIADFQISERQRLQDAQVNIAGQTAELLGQIAGKNKQLAMAALILEKGAAAAAVVINAQREKASNAVMAAANPLNVLTGGAAGQAQLASLNALTNIRTGLSLATIAATGINGAKNISSGGGGGVQPPNVSGTQTDFNRPNTPQPQKVYILETEIRSSMRKVDDIYTQATIS